MEDFYGMKRKQLQALCKKHGVPANLTNCEMANRLSLLFKVPLNYNLSSHTRLFYSGIFDFSGFVSIVWLLRKQKQSVRKPKITRNWGKSVPKRPRWLR